MNIFQTQQAVIETEDPVQGSSQVPRHNGKVILWLALVSLCICLMVVVGGATRLTQSGLSMVDWRPVTGVLPPLNQAQWQAAFDAYKQYPEYQKINRGMDLDAFKRIFYWEYAHRLLGRLLGLLFLLPFVYFLMRGQIERRWQPWLWGAFVIGGMQGLMGWYMVQSGLVEVPRVSHLRLAAHLMLALGILAYLIWLMLAMNGKTGQGVAAGQRRLAWFTAGLLVVQLLLGAMTAGLKAGQGFNTWPLMHGQWLADAALMMEPVWRNLLDNGVMLQFLHRWLGLALLLAAVWLAWRQRPGLQLQGRSEMAVQMSNDPAAQTSNDPATQTSNDPAAQTRCELATQTGNDPAMQTGNDQASQTSHDQATQASGTDNPGRLKLLLSPAFLSLLFLGLTVMQFLLGIATLLLHVPILLGILHQAVAMLMLITMTCLLYVSQQPGHDEIQGQGWHQAMTRPAP